jgi:hypothetical protein
MVSRKGNYQAETSKFSWFWLASASEKFGLITFRKTHLRKVCRNNGAIGELSTGQSSKCLACGFWSVEFDENLADSIGLSASAGRSRYLHIKNLAILLTFLLHIFANF